MKKAIYVAIMFAGIALFSATGWAQSAKNAVQVGQVSLVSDATTTSTHGWSTIMSSTLHTANQKDLIVGVSLEVGLFTETTVKSKGGSKDESSAEAKVEIMVLVDGQPAEPGEVVFARRYQELMAKFGGIIESCTDSNGDGTIHIETECDVTAEELRLVLDTMGAHAFNFILADLTSGDHSIEVLARITTNSDWDTGSASAGAVLGKGSVTVQEVRLTKSQDLSL